MDQETSSRTKLTNSIAFHYISAVLLLVVTLQLLLGVFITVQNFNQQKSDLRQKAFFEAGFLGAVGVEAVLANNFLYLESLARQASADSDIVYCVIVHNDGRALTRYLNRQDPIIADVLENTPSNNLLDVVTNAGMAPGVREIIVPIVADDVTLGMVRIGYSLASAQERLVVTLAANIGIAILVSLVLIGLTVLLFKWQIGDPLREVARSATALARGNLDQRLEETGRNELLELKRAFNSMAQQLQQRLDDLQNEQRQTALANQALLESEQRLRAVTSNVPVILYALDHEGKFIFLDGQGLFAAQLDPEQVIGQSIFDVYGDEPEIHHHIRAALKGQTIQTVQEVRGVIFEYSGAPISDEHGAVLGVIGVAIDITERTRFERALRQSEAQFRLLVESAPEAIVITGEDGRIELVNNQAESVFGYDRADMINQSITMLIPERFRQNHGQYLARYMEHPETRPMGQGRELSGLHKDGREFPIEVGLSAIETEQGWRVMSFVIDITARKRAEEELRFALEKEKELGELKSRFVSMASHEFRTPLTSISSTASFMEIAEGKLTPEKRQYRLQKIQTAVARMTGLLDEVLLYGKAEADRLDFNPEAIEIVAICAEIAEDLQHTLRGSHQLTFTVTGDTDTSVMADEELMRQIVTNLLSNAVKYSPEGSTIEFELSCTEPDDVVLTVRDHGIGIPVADQKRLFEPFHRAQNAKQIQGTGLGLAITQKAVEAHLGTIEFESEPNEGTTFVVRIPRTLPTT